MTASSDRRDRADPHQGYWREYRVGPLTEVAYVVGTTLIACAVGLGASFAALLLIGLLGEQGLLIGLGEIIDQVTRASMGWVLLFAYSCAVLVTAAHSVRAVGVSRALVRAAESGADPLAAPHPAQVEQVVLGPHLSLCILLGIQAGTAAMVAAVAAVEGEGVIGIVSAVVLVGSVALLLVLLKVSGPAHRRRQRRIAEHWTAHAEQTAWGAARKAVRTAGARPRLLGPGSGDGDRRVRGGDLLLAVGGTGGGLSLVLLEVFLFVQYPGTVATPGARVRDRGDFSDGAQAVIDGLLWVAVVLGLAGLVLAAVGALVAARGRSADRAALADKLDDVTATRPEPRLLTRYAERGPSDVGQVAAGLGAFVLVPALAVLTLATRESDLFLDSTELFAGTRGPATGGVVAGGLLVVAGLAANAAAGLRGYALRDRLQRRWPTLPKPPEEKDSRRYAPRTKPTLRRGL